jgi:hypothetical protein
MSSRDSRGGNPRFGAPYLHEMSCSGGGFRVPKPLRRLEETGQRTNVLPVLFKAVESPSNQHHASSLSLGPADLPRHLKIALRLSGEKRSCRPSCGGRVTRKRRTFVTKNPIYLNLIQRDRTIHIFRFPIKKGLTGNCLGSPTTWILFFTKFYPRWLILQGRLSPWPGNL